MGLMAAECSRQGGRSYNEDSVRCVMNEPMLVLTVADGLGGHGGGEIASTIVVDTVAELFVSNPRISAENLQHIFETANQRILSVQTPACQMKSTGVTLMMSEDSVLWGHVGDSRLYHFVNGKRVFQTNDHSVSYMAVLSGEITLSKVRFHEDRNKVLRAFGNDDAIKPELSAVQRLSNDFHAFLLCTDGFWEYVLEDEMEIDLAKSQTPNEWIAYMIGRLGKRVSVNNDNFTAAAVFYTKSERGSI